MIRENHCTIIGICLVDKIFPHQVCRMLLLFIKTVRNWKLKIKREGLEVNPFDTVRSCKIRLFQRQNRGIVIRDTRRHEISILGWCLKCWSAGVMLGFHWHQVWFVSLPPGGHYTWWKVPFTLEFLKNYLKSVTLIVTCVRDFTDWDLLWCHVGVKCGHLLIWPWDDSRV